MRMNAHDFEQIWPRRDEFFASWRLAGCTVCHHERPRTVHMGNAEFKQDMLLHKIGSLLGSAPAGQAPARRLYGARVSGRLCRVMCTSRGRSASIFSVADAVHELVAGVGAAHGLGRFRLVRELLGLVAAFKQTRQESRREPGAEAVLVFRALARLSEARRLRDDGRTFAVGSYTKLVRRGLAEGHEGRGEGGHGHEGAEDLHFWREYPIGAQASF